MNRENNLVTEEGNWRKSTVSNEPTKRTMIVDFEGRRLHEYSTSIQMGGKCEANKKSFYRTQELILDSVQAVFFSLSRYKSVCYRHLTE